MKATSKGVTVYPQSPNDYRSIVSCLRTSGAAFHTYQLPEDKNPRIVIKNLHYNTPLEEIKIDLEKHGYKVEGITNAISRFKKPLPIFFVDIKKATFNEKVFDITKIYYTRVTIEEPRKKKYIPQCLRCQKYGHTRSYCNHAARCVRCGQPHDSSTCTKTRDTPAKCANCQGEHPANYRGCQTLRDLRAQKKKRINDHERVPPPSINPKDFPDLPQPPRSYQTQQENQNQQQHRLQNAQQAEKQPASGVQTTRPSATMGDEITQPYSTDPSSQFFQILNSLNALIQPLFGLLQQLAQVTQSLCLQNGHLH